MSAFRTLTPSLLSKAAFIEAFKDIYEHSPWVAEGAYLRCEPAQRDDKNLLLAAMAATVQAASTEQQLALICAHPDLAGKAAIEGTLTNASTAEQSGAGIQHCTPDEFAQFNTLNHAYKAKFGFPFIMAVKGSNRHLILAAFAERINNDYTTEFNTALEQINTIAQFRLDDM